MSGLTPAIVIVNYRTAGLAIDCLRSLATEVNVDRGDHVYVVDGHSQDGSAERISGAIKEAGWTWASLHALDRNGGFAFANNHAIRCALDHDNPPDCFWLINSDTVVHPGSLEAHLAFLEERPRAGIVGGGIQNTAGEVEHSSFRFPNIWSELDLHLRWGLVTRLLKEKTFAPEQTVAPHRTDWVSGANLMIRRELLNHIGFLDEEFFLYYEETDFCRRSHLAGWECWNLPEACVTHIGGASTGLDHHHGESHPRPQYWFDSRRRFFLKHHGRVYAAVTDCVAIACLMLWNMRRIVQKKARQDPPRYMTDLLRNSAMFSGPTS